MKRRLITSALPYVNNVPHLGNLIQVVSADVFARFSVLRGYDTLYICGTDEYGTATETRAYLEKKDPAELCDQYHALHASLYDWFQVGFSYFGRSTDPQHTAITQDLFRRIYNAGLVHEQSITQLYSEESERFLADRYIVGTCPHCRYTQARGDQCEHCGSLLDPIDLIEPRSAIDNSVPVARETKHLYLDLPALQEKLLEWIEKSSAQGKWSRNALSMTRAWLRDGLRARAITRDLRWGIPVPLKGYEEKVFYVWFDAPIGYISMTAQYMQNWQDWWLGQNDVELFQFVGKDNIPFHTVIFPAVLIGSGQPWTMLQNISSTEFMNYEGGMFSKSRGIGIFADDARDSGIPAAVWRFYLMYNRPESSDYNFSWKDFQQMVNTELIGNFSNFINRVLSFSIRYFDGKVCSVQVEPEFRQTVEKHCSAIEEQLECIRLRQALRQLFQLSDYANTLFQHREPWNMRKVDPGAAQNFISMLVYLVRNLAILITPFMPDIAQSIAGFLGCASLRWDMLGSYEGISTVVRPNILFNILDDTLVQNLQKRYSGAQAEQPAVGTGSKAGERDKKNTSESSVISSSAISESDYAREFSARVDLCAARIISVEHHPNADTLYVLSLEIGSEDPRTIVSGLVGYYNPEELTGKTIVLVRNLKPAKLRGIQSKGMLLAARKDNDLEVIFLDSAAAGSKLTVAGVEQPDQPDMPRISIEAFRAFPLRINDQGQLSIGGSPIQYNSHALYSKRLRNCSVE